MKRSRPFHLYCTALLCLCAMPALFAEDIYNEDFFWLQNLTETWSLMDYDQTIASFSDSYGRAVYQIIALDQTDDAAALNLSIAASLGASTSASPPTESEPLLFQFNGHEAALSEALWSTGQNDVRGYIISIAASPQQPEALHYPYDYVLIAFSIADEFEVYHDFLLSNLDGFAPLISEYQAPGPISQFIRTSAPPSPAPAPGDTLNPNTADIEAAYATIQREARILNQFADAPPDIIYSAWRRYYQMLYKDSLYDMRSTAAGISERFKAENRPMSEYPAEVLSWLQDFAYKRTGTLSDLEPALVCIANESGDCDSLGLAYMAILEHLNIDSILMISPKHSHSLVGVDIAGDGARFPFMGTEWLVAELTTDVPIGSIAREQANPVDWLGFDMGIHPEY